jgi:arylsulfatase A-like enzyme
MSRSTRLLQSALLGILLGWGTTLVEGIVRTLHGEGRGFWDWVYALGIYAWFGVALGLLWGAFLLLAGSGSRATRLRRAALVPGLLFAWSFVVGGYWLNHWRKMPDFGSPQGKLWTLLFGLALLVPCLALAALLWRRRVPEAQGRGWRRAPALLGGLLALWVAPPILLALLPHEARRVPRGPRAEGPPVVVILVDTLRRDHLEVYGYDRPTSPNLARLARDAIVFTESTTTGNMTVPSVATLFTGLYPSQHRVIWVSRRLPEEVPTLPELFRRGGYRTAAFVGNPVVRPEMGFQRGFDTYYPQPPPRWVFHRKTAIELLALRLMHGQRSTRIANLVERALAWLARGEDRPPFLYLHVIEPHSPYDPPPGDAEPFLPPGTRKWYRWPPLIWNYRPLGEWASWEDLERKPEVTPERRRVLMALYDGDIRYTDRILGNFLDGMRRLGLYDKSLIVVLADHGEEFADHGGWYHGLTLYEEMVRMPLLVKLPGNLGAGLRTDLSVDMVDILPTLAGLAGLPDPAPGGGKDYAEAILQVARGLEVEGTPSAFVERPPYLYALRVGRWKILSKTLRGETTLRLFDLLEDPGETRDVSALWPDTLVVMRRMLRQLLAHVSPQEGWGPDQEGDRLDPETRRQLRNLGYIN